MLKALEYFLNYRNLRIYLKLSLSSHNGLMLTMNNQPYVYLCHLCSKDDLYTQEILHECVVQVLYCSSS